LTLDKNGRLRRVIWWIRKLYWTWLRSKWRWWR